MMVGEDRTKTPSKDQPASNSPFTPFTNIQIRKVIHNDKYSNSTEMSKREYKRPLYLGA